MQFETTLHWRHLTIPLSATLPEPNRPLLFVLDKAISGQLVICGFYGPLTERFYSANDYWHPHQVLAWAYVDGLGQQVRKLIEEGE